MKNALKSYGIACKNAALSTTGKVASGAMLLAVNSAAFAQESTTEAAITAAKTAGLSMVGLAIAAVIGIAALVMGLGIVLGLIKR